MKFFRTKENGEKDIKLKPYASIVTYNDKKIKVVIEDAQVMEEGNNEVVLDDVIVKSMIDDIAKAVIRNQSKYNDIPSKIVISHGDYDVEKKENKENKAKKENKESKEDNIENKTVENKTIVNSYLPKYKFEDVCINNSVKKQINTTLAIIKNRDILYKDWGLGDGYFSNRAVVLNFYGHPGTGKSMAAEAIANHLNKKICLVNYAELESKFVGETPKNIKNAFELAKKENAVLVFDEADSFLGKRLTSVTQSADYGVNITRSVLLLELEKFDGVVIFTTNLLANYDDAFKRRILANVMFDKPDNETRQAIWKVHLNKKIPLDSEITTKLLADKYENITGADIKDIIFYAATNALEKNKDRITIEEFDYAYSIIIERYTNKMGKSEFNDIKMRNEIITEEQYLNEVGSDK